MGFLDVPSPTPRNKEYYLVQYQHALNLSNEAAKQGKPESYCKMLQELASTWKQRADNL